MKRAGKLLAGMVVFAGLVACGEKPQTLGVNKSDISAYQGAQNQFVAPGWKVGDKTSWEQGLKTRAKNSQNEYSKTN